MRTPTNLDDALQVVDQPVEPSVEVEQTTSAVSLASVGKPFTPRVNATTGVPVSEGLPLMYVGILSEMRIPPVVPVVVNDPKPNDVLVSA